MRRKIVRLLREEGVRALRSQLRMGREGALLIDETQVTHGDNYIPYYRFTPTFTEVAMQGRSRLMSLR